jgi:hypothetical protein
MYNRWATVADWESELSTAVANDKSMDAGLPVYPFIWPQWDNGASGQLTSSDWNTEVTYLESDTQGAIVWANASTALNTGSSTSAATKLLAATGPQGIRESCNSSAGPALAPGASWSTTLQIAVPSTETDQTALLEGNYGTGFRRLIAIVP